MYSIDIIFSEQEWLRQRESFNTLAGEYITRRFEWQLAWWHAFKTETMQLKILVVKDGQQVLGYLPIFEQRTAAGTELHLIGSGKACSDDLGIYSKVGYETECADCVVDHLYQTGLRGDWNILKLEGVRNDCVAMNRLLLAFRKQFTSGFYEQADQVCRVAYLGTDQEAFVRDRMSSNSRRLYRKLHRQYIENKRFEANFAQTKEQAFDQLQAISKLHQARRQAKGEFGCLAHPSFAKFLHNLCDNLFDRREWLSVVVSIDGQIAAGMVGAIRKPWMSTYLCGMDTQMAEHRPGTLMNIACMKLAIELGCTKFDMMRGNEVYKSRLGGTAIPQFVWTAYAPRIVPRVLGRITETKNQLGSWLRNQFREQASESMNAD